MEEGQRPGGLTDSEPHQQEHPGELDHDDADHDAEDDEGGPVLEVPALFQRRPLGDAVGDPLFEGLRANMTPTLPLAATMGR